MRSALIGSLLMRARNNPHSHNFSHSCIFFFLVLGTTMWPGRLGILWEFFGNVFGSTCLLWLALILVLNVEFRFPLLVFHVFIQLLEIRGESAPVFLKKKMRKKQLIQTELDSLGSSNWKELNILEGLGEKGESWEWLGLVFPT